MQICCTTGECVDALLFPQQGVFPSPCVATAPDGSVLPRRRRCSSALQRGFRVLAAIFFYGLLLWHRGTIRSASSVSFCILFLTSQKKYAAGGTVTASLLKTEPPVAAGKGPMWASAPTRCYAEPSAEQQPRPHCKFGTPVPTGKRDSRAGGAGIKNADRRKGSARTGGTFYLVSAAFCSASSSLNR